MSCETENSGSESQETSTTTISEPEAAINISFKDICYNVRDGSLFSCCGKWQKEKEILKGVTGTFKGGELSAIMGQSGAGKSTLMDILAAYTKPTSGQLYVNGLIRDEKWYRRRSCYIMQDDMLQHFLTVDESLKVAADLKLGAHVSKEQKQKRIREILDSVDLKSARQTRTGCLSGGEQKRLAIGLELISDPPVMILDEPTSGLDSSKSKQIIYLLHLLARQGRTVIISLHQPSVLLLKMIDRLYCLADGSCAYMGSVPKLVPYLETLNLKCPPFHNPVDFLMDICAEQTIKEPLVEASRNGTSDQWTSNIVPDIDDDIIQIGEIIKSRDGVSLTALPPPRQTDTSKILSKLKSTYSTSPWTQFCVLTKRSLLIYWRNPGFTRTVIGIHLVVAVFIGILMFNIGKEAQFIKCNNNFMFFSLMFLMFTAFSAVSISFPRELPAVRREHFNRWYNTGAYYTSTVMAALPTQTCCALAYALITYWLTGQPLEWSRFFGFSWMLIQVSCVSLILGLLNGACFSVQNAVMCGPIILMPFTVFSGFFLRLLDAPWLFRLFFHISFVKHGFVGLMLSIYGMEREDLKCNAVYCHYRKLKTVLDDQGISKDTYSFAVIILFVISTLVSLTTYVILKIRLKKKW